MVAKLTWIAGLRVGVMRYVARAWPVTALPTALHHSSVACCTPAYNLVRTASVFVSAHAALHCSVVAFAASSIA
jgi:hypothetical protein